MSQSSAYNKSVMRREWSIFYLVWHVISSAVPYALSDGQT
jgi:hypothetical protein